MRGTTAKAATEFSWPTFLVQKGDAFLTGVSAIVVQPAGCQIQSRYAHTSHGARYPKHHSWFLWEGRMEIVSHWHHLVDDFNTSVLDFYEAVEEAVGRRAIPDAQTSRVDFKEGTIVSAKREYLRVSRGQVSFDICAAPFGNGFFFSWWLVRPGPAHPWLWFFGVLAAITLWLFMMGSAVFQFAQQTLVGGAGGLVSLLIVFLALPVGVFFLGWSVREGYFGDEEIVMAIPIVGWLYERCFSPQTYYRHDTAIMFRDSVARAVNEVLNGVLEEQGLRMLSPEELKPSVRQLARQAPW